MSKSKGKKIMMYVLGILIIIIVFILVFFNIPYSKTVNEFNAAVDRSMIISDKSNNIITLEDIKDLPKPLQKYFNYCGYIGKTKKSYMKLTIEDATLISNGKKLNVEYLQYNFVKKPIRLALIKSSLLGIPFQGFDSYENGIGSMKGVIGKTITLFDIRGNEMDKSCLATFLAESLLSPSIALQDYITWTEIDDLHAKATITYYNISASGVFTFDENGLYLSFETNDRYITNPDNSLTQLKWTSVIENYVDLDGILKPTSYKAIWNYPDRDFAYFYSENINIE